MRVLVAGSAGFIGSHLCTRLLDDGHEVVGVDNYCTGQQRNTTDLEPRDRFTFVNHDIIDAVPVEGAFDLVCNLACPASPTDFATRRLAILDVCSRGTRNLLDLARDRQARFLQASTSEVYGDPQVHPQPETYWGNVNPAGPRSCYDEGKRFAEALIASYRMEYGLETRVVRIFNTYGPRMRRDDGRALPTFIDQALANKPLTVHGDGSQTRSFCYVSDLVDGIVLLAQSSATDPVNIGNQAEVTILEFAREIIAQAGSTSEIVFVERPRDDPSLRCPNITRAREWLGWEAKVDRAAGLARTVDWFRSNP